MDNKHDENILKQEDTEINVIEKDPTQHRQQLSKAERKAILDKTLKEVFEKYHDVFEKLSKN